jgi:hypothetical protein
MSGVAEQIMKQGERVPEGTVLSAKAFLHVGTRAAVDQALSRLARGGRLMRVGRGRYVRPVPTRFGMRTPAPEKVMEGLAAVTGETVVPSGAVAANALGLTTQVPARTVFLSSGPTRRLRLGSQVVEVRHAPAWQLLAPDRPAGQAIRALTWLGPSRAREAAATLWRTLPEQERRVLVSACGRFPEWLARTVSEVAGGGSAGSPSAVHA